MDVPVVWRGDDAAVGLRGLDTDGVRLERIQPNGIVWPVRFTQPLSKVDDRTDSDGCF
jgi:hypothetical protein